MIRPPVIGGVITWPDGREECLLDTVAGKAAYEYRRAELVDRQRGLCAICGEWMAVPYVDHQSGRGSGGSRRDDRVLIGGEWHNAALDFDCNSKKGSRRYAWVGGVYVPVIA